MKREDDRSPLPLWLGSQESSEHMEERRELITKTDRSSALGVSGLH